MRSVRNVAAGGLSSETVIVALISGGVTLAGVIASNSKLRAHYQVESSGRIGQLAWDRDTAWHTGNWNANRTSIGIEHADVSSSPWRVSDACLESGAHLVAGYYKLG